MQVMLREAPQTDPQDWEALYADSIGQPLPPKWAAALIERMQALYGAQFSRQWESIKPERLPQIWAEELAGFSGQEIAAGLAACKTRQWPPTLPEFMALCRPWLDAEVAFREAVAGMSARRKGELGIWSHPAVYWTAVRVGTHDLLACGWQTMRTRWEAAFNETLAEGRWYPVPAPAQQLPAPGAATFTRDEADRLAAKVRQMTGETATPAAGVKDHKAWARRILDNPKGRTPTVVNMARQALGLETEGLPA